MSESEDQELVRACLRGNTAAFAELVDRYQKVVYNAALRLVGDRDDALDVTQNVFVAAFEKLSTFNPKYRFFSWIYRMTVNQSLNLINQKKSLEPLSPALVSREKTPVESLAAAEREEAISDALLALKIESRVVIVLRHFGECSYREMSYILDLPEKTIKSRLFSARHQLKDILLAKGIETND